MIFNREGRERIISTIESPMSSLPLGGALARCHHPVTSLTSAHVPLRTVRIRAQRETPLSETRVSASSPAPTPVFRQLAFRSGAT